LIIINAKVLFETAEVNMNKGIQILVRCVVTRTMLSGLWVG